MICLELWVFHVVLFFSPQVISESRRGKVIVFSYTAGIPNQPQGFGSNVVRYTDREGEREYPPIVLSNILGGLGEAESKWGPLLFLLVSFLLLTTCICLWLSSIRGPKHMHGCSVCPPKFHALAADFWLFPCTSGLKPWWFLLLYVDPRKRSSQGIKDVCDCLQGNLGP